MKYFIDFEFIEGFHKPLFGKRRHFIDLISIGIVSEDGREYYAISNEFDPRKANQWVRDNVIAKLEPKQLFDGYTFPGFDGEYMPEEKYKPNPVWKSNKQIILEVLQFIYDPNCDEWATWLGPGDEYFNALHKIDNSRNPKFYGYFSAYDWVLFCSLFGTMMDLPKGFPMYCRDLKQMLDEKVMAFKNNDFLYYADDAPLSFEQKLKLVKDRIDYPQEKSEHHALADAKWTKELYTFITEKL